MSELTEWTVIADDDTELRSDPGPCPTGFDNHTWTVEIEEGDLILTPVETCNGECAWWEVEDVFSSGPLAVVKVRVDSCDAPGGWHGLTRCECAYAIALDPVATS